MQGLGARRHPTAPFVIPRLPAAMCSWPTPRGVVANDVPRPDDSRVKGEESRSTERYRPCGGPEPGAVPKFGSRVPACVRLHNLVRGAVAGLETGLTSPAAPTTL